MHGTNGRGWSVESVLLKTYKKTVKNPLLLNKEKTATNVRAQRKIENKI